MKTHLEIVTPPAIEPITLVEAKGHCRVTLTLEDGLFAYWIETARRDAEKETQRAIITQTWDYFLDCFPASGEIRLPKPPLQSVTTVKYYIDDVLETLSAAEYHVTTGTPGRVILADGSSWPTIDRRPDAVVVRFVAGYGLAVDVPANLKAGMLVHIGDLYKYRERSAVGIGIVAMEIPHISARLYDSERWGGDDYS